MNSVTYSSSGTFFSILISGKRSNFTLVLFKPACHANPGTVRKRERSISMFQRTYFKSSQIYLLTIMDRFEHKNHDILLNVLFLNLYKLFLRARNLHH